MGSFDRWAHRKIKQSQVSKAKKAKEAEKAAGKSKQFANVQPDMNKYKKPITIDYETDNDGNPILPEPMGYIRTKARTMYD